MVTMTLAIVVHIAHVCCGPRGIAVHSLHIALRTLGSAHRGVGSRIGHWLCMFAHSYPDTGNGTVICVLLHAVERGFLPCTVGCMRKDSIKRSPGTRWLAMVLKAMKIAKRQSAVKKVDTAKSDVMQKNKAK